MKQHPKPGCWRGESLTVAHRSHHDLITFYLMQQEPGLRILNLTWIKIHDLQTPCHLSF